MKSTELRVGNLVSVDGKNLPVTQIFEKGFNCGNVGVLYELAKPIPLTEEWLERLLTTRLENDITISRGVSSGIIHVVIGQVHYVKVEYVHQLQNLYFALTGEELKQNKEDGNSTDIFNNNGIPSV